MKFGNEFWLILFRDHISPKLFAVHDFTILEPILILIQYSLFFHSAFLNFVHFAFLIPILLVFALITPNLSLLIMYSSSSIHHIS